MTVFPARNATVSVPNTSTEVLHERGAFNPRTEFVITNRDLTLSLTLSFGQTAVFGSGVILSPGASYYQTSDLGYMAYQGQVNAIASAAGPVNVAIYER